MWRWDPTYFVNTHEKDERPWRESLWRYLPSFGRSSWLEQVAFKREHIEMSLTGIRTYPREKVGGFEESPWRGATPRISMITVCEVNASNEGPWRMVTLTHSDKTQPWIILCMKGPYCISDPPGIRNQVHLWKLLWLTTGPVRITWYDVSGHFWYCPH